VIGCPEGRGVLKARRHRLGVTGMCEPPGGGGGRARARRRGDTWRGRAGPRRLVPGSRLPTSRRPVSAACRPVPGASSATGLPRVRAPRWASGSAGPGPAGPACSRCAWAWRARGRSLSHLQHPPLLQALHAGIQHAQARQVLVMSTTQDKQDGGSNARTHAHPRTPTHSFAQSHSRAQSLAYAHLRLTSTTSYFLPLAFLLFMPGEHSLVTNWIFRRRGLDYDGFYDGGLYVVLLTISVQ
jgi:hypothetical protein